MKATEALLSPFECSRCHGQKCRVETILPKYTETHEVGILITCYEDGEMIATIAVSESCGEMLLEAEKENIRDELANKN